MEERPVKFEVTRLAHRDVISVPEFKPDLPEIDDKLKSYILPEK